MNSFDNLDYVASHLERDLLRNIVLLKYLKAFPDSTSAHHIDDGDDSASLVLTEVEASFSDRRDYPWATLVALISSDHPRLTGYLLDFVPEDVGIVFKLATEADREAVAARFPVEPSARFFSYSSKQCFNRQQGVRMTTELDDTVLSVFEDPGHVRTWLGPLLASGRAFICVVDVDGALGSICLAFESYGRIWEIGGVYTLESLRGRGLAQTAVRTALARLGELGFTPRYDVNAENAASVALAQRLGLDRFMTLTHHLRRPSS